MRERKFPNAGKDEGFSTVEMIILLAVLAVFLAGVVILTARGVSTFDPAKGATRLYHESNLLFDRLGALLSSGRAISLEQPALTPASMGQEGKQRRRATAPGSMSPAWRLLPYSVPRRGQTRWSQGYGVIPPGATGGLDLNARPDQRKGFRCRVFRRRW